MPASELRESWKTLRVPASSANLGPGFDALGLALDIYLETRFRPAEALEIRVSGRDSALDLPGRRQPDLADRAAGCGRRR